MKVLFSIIIPVRIETPYLAELLSKLKDQTQKSYEVIVVTDKISKTSNPAVKRNWGAKKAKGQYLAFLDDDSYPDPRWLQNALKLFQDFPEVCIFGGPCLTPPNDSPFQRASGLVWSSFLGSGGAGNYRNSIQKLRYITDYPSVNLLIHKDDFLKIGGFQENHWPGEDTLLCRDVLLKLHKKILYHPSIIVFHHRRAVIIPHLKQISRYAIHRGYFARAYPENSRQIGYFIPTAFAFYCLLLPLSIGHKIYLLPLFVYCVLLGLTAITFIKKNSLFITIIATITIPLTHLYYGILFCKGFIGNKPPFIPHQLNRQNKSYLGG